MKNILSFLKLKRDEDGKPTKMSYVILIGLLGLLLMLTNNLFKDQSQTTEPPIGESLEDEALFKQNKEEKSEEVLQMEERLEGQLKQILDQINGISEAEVMINLDATNLKVYEKNTIVGKQTTSETDQNGGKREIEDYSEEQQTVTIRNQNNENPILVQTKKPSVRGVLVVAKGLESVERQKIIVTAVSRVLDVSSHRVSVMPKE
ncbi:stage III sporulation protein AG [Salirhabdus salicampi]|uniref:stage III sporulation protein AG n=1 Tax=Salirhabdus salicampi TaxID=476102 RepID=UPI0020C3D972|nr:stage III sporulation protein AG [Salirhabdus salicampi]MCP8616821.1 stage III sporulation protein AG [Salirhabdus salicampi]